jgi:hypothetical protein
MASELKKEIDSRMRIIGEKGVNKIRNELDKHGQKANVSFAIEKNKIKFFVKPKTEKIETDKSTKEMAKFKDVLGPVPLELLNQEIVKENFSTDGITKAMKQVNREIEKEVNTAIAKII